MPKFTKLKPNVAFFLISVLVILIGSWLIWKNFTVQILLLVIAGMAFGFWMGNANNPANSYRKKKVKKQSRDISDLTEQFKIQTAAMESAANGIIITDIKGFIQWVNPGFTRLTGYSSEEALGRSLKFLNSGVHDQSFFSQMWSQILSGQVWHDEVVNKRKDGLLYTEEMTITPILDKAGKIKNFVAIKQDITERKRLEEILKTEKKRMETELDVAREIQMSMLPKNEEGLKKPEDVDIYARLIPAREVGGDFYDYFWLDDENLCFLIGDVSGKGVPAALMMAVTKTLLKSAARSTKSTSKTLTQVNNEISKDNDNYMFITVFIGILNTTTGYLTYSNAGHNPSYLFDGVESSINALNELHGVVIGAMENIQYKETVIRMNRGGSIFVYTDGITEARNKENQLFSDERLVACLSNRSLMNPKDLVTSIIDEVKIHEDGAEQADDITVLYIQFMEQTDDSVVDYLFRNLSNNLESISIFSSEFEEFAIKHSIEQETIQQLRIVFDELLSNIVKYAYQDKDFHEIEVKVRYYGAKLTVTILDDGKPFNPFESGEPDTTLALEDRDIGGLGIHLVKFLVDDYEYNYQEQILKNSTHFIKHINSEIDEN